ncbi:universal stress protein [Nocardia grenadensis]|uniref:universal stress protein n=1 Tax=Nocardia grenadensis TaxID=931537 RepID=UPI0009FF4640|nr:universal stress protein [Nocardia grenadensis]
MSETTVRPPTTPITTAVDGSASSFRAAAWAGLEASLCGRGVHLIVSCALPPRSAPSPEVDEPEAEWLRADAEWVLDEAVRITRATTGGVTVAVTTEVTFDAIASVLLERSPWIPLLVVGRRGRGGISRTVIGSLSSAVAAHADCPVAVVSGQSGTDPVSRSRPVAVGVDGSAHSVAALDTAFAEAARRDVGLVAVHCWSDTSGIRLPGRSGPPDQTLLDEQLAAHSDRYPAVPVHRIVRTDAPARSLVGESEWAQLLVVGRHGRGGAAGTVLGAVTVALLYAAECPLLIVHR